MSPYSQSAAEFTARYPVVTSYEVRPGILMTPTYTADGQVCAMSFERQHATKSGIDLDSLISKKLADDIINQLAPLSERGKEVHDPPHPSGMYVTAGGISQTLYNYENLDVTFWGVTTGERAGTVAVMMSWKNRKCKDEGKQLPLYQYPR